MPSIDGCRCAGGGWHSADCPPLSDNAIRTSGACAGPYAGCVQVVGRIHDDPTQVDSSGACRDCRRDSPLTVPSQRTRLPSAPALTCRTSVVCVPPSPQPTPPQQSLGDTAFVPDNASG